MQPARAVPGKKPTKGAKYANGVLCGPKTSSTSCDQAIFVDQATGACLFSDAVLAEVD
jgi:hypothetical protein